MQRQSGSKRFPSIAGRQQGATAWSTVIMHIVRHERRNGGGEGRELNRNLPQVYALPRLYLVWLTPCGHSTRPPVFTAIIKCKLIFRNCQILAARSFGHGSMRLASGMVTRGGDMRWKRGAMLLASFHPFSNNNPSPPPSPRPSKWIKPRQIDKWTFRGKRDTFWKIYIRHKWIVWSIRYMTLLINHRIIVLYVCICTLVHSAKSEYHRVTYHCNLSR